MLGRDALQGHGNPLLKPSCGQPRRDRESHSRHSVPSSSPPTCTHRAHCATGQRALHRCQAALFPSRNSLTAFMAYSSDLASSSPHFHSRGISESKSSGNLSSIEETKSEVRTQKTHSRILASWSRILKPGLDDHNTDGL